MRVLCFGDVMGKPGRTAFSMACPRWKKKYAPDVTIANGENLAHGKGMSQKALAVLFQGGVDIVTSGNHIFGNREAYNILSDETKPVLRPANLHPDLPGKGWHIMRVGKKRIGVINLVGRLFMPQHVDDPFRIADTLLQRTLRLKKFRGSGVSCDAIIVDWHAEATSEKVAMGWHLDGRVSLVFGTHTHVPTDDARILPQGTAYISDIGMVGPYHSILGLQVNAVLEKFRLQVPTALELADGPVEVNAVLVDITSDGRASEVRHIREVVHI